MNHPCTPPMHKALQAVEAVEAVEAARRPEAWPAHLLAPSPGGWSWWKEAVLRSAGFPAQGLARLRDAELARLADELDAAERRLQRAVEAAGALVHEAIARLRQGGADAHKDRLRALNRSQKALKALRGGHMAESPIEGLSPAMEAQLRSAASGWSLAMGALQAGFPDALERTGHAASAFAADPLLRRAVAWQNTEAVRTALDPLAAQEPMSGSKRRQREALVANYAQRYLVKNDTIGFFGPMAWVRIEDSPGEPRFDCGPGLVRHRSVHYEDWAVGALEQRLADDERFLPWLVPQLQPFLHADGDRLRLPGGHAVRLGKIEAAVLPLCDGSRTAREIARSLPASDPFGPPVTPAQVFAALQDLHRQRRISLGFGVPSCRDNPDHALRQALERIDDTALRREPLQALDQLATARRRVEQADDADAILAAMAALHEDFDRVVGGPTRRRQGEVYGGRALVYEDCHRDLTLTLASDALQPALQPLELVMTAARWLTAQAGTRFEAVLATEFRRLQAEQGLETVHLPDFWLRAQSLIFGDQVPLDDLALELRDRWEDVLFAGEAPPAGPVQVTVAAIQAGVQEAFPATRTAWKLARYQCPDLMFCADSPEQLLRGDFLAVLGEVHVGGNTVMTNLFASQHPDVDALLNSVRLDLGSPYVMPKLSPQASGTPTRTQWLDDPVHAVEIVFSQGFVAAEPATAVPIAALDVASGPDGLTVRHKQSGWSAPLMEALGDFLFLAVINRFGILHKRRHTPRVTVGKLVIQRESWTFDASELAFALQPDEPALFCGARAWRSAQGLPETLFAKMSWEAKPVYLDFQSLLSVRMLGKQIRHAAELPAARITLSEVLPGLHELWCTDSTGQRYTSELRLVAIHGDDVRASFSVRERACP